MKIFALLAFLAVVRAQAPLPTYVGAGAAFNQIGTPRWNVWAAAIYPAYSPAGVYLSTTTDVVPVRQVDPTTKIAFYAFQTSVRQGLHKTVLARSSFTLLLGGDAGIGMSQASPSGISVSFAGSVTATAVWQLSKSWAVVLPVRGLWQSRSSTWNALPEIGILFKP